MGFNEGAGRGRGRWGRPSVSLSPDALAVTQKSLFDVLKGTFKKHPGVWHIRVGAAELDRQTALPLDQRFAAMFAVFAYGYNEDAQAAQRRVARGQSIFGLSDIDVAKYKAVFAAMPQERYDIAAAEISKSVILGNWILQGGHASKKISHRLLLDKVPENIRQQLGEEGNDLLVRLARVRAAIGGKNPLTQRNVLTTEGRDATISPVFARMGARRGRKPGNSQYDQAMRMYQTEEVFDPEVIIKRLGMTNPAAIARMKHEVLTSLVNIYMNEHPGTTPTANKILEEFGLSRSNLITLGKVLRANGRKH